MRKHLATGLFVVVALGAFGSRAAAASFSFGNGDGIDAMIIFDGSQDVLTEQTNCSFVVHPPTCTTSVLGAIQPKDIQAVLTGLYPGVTFSQFSLSLLLSMPASDCTIAGCESVSDFETPFVGGDGLSGADGTFDPSPDASQDVLRLAMGSYGSGGATTITPSDVTNGSPFGTFGLFASDQTLLSGLPAGALQGASVGFELSYTFGTIPSGFSDANPLEEFPTFDIAVQSAISAVPEPTTLLLLVSGVTLLAARRRRDI